MIDDLQCGNALIPGSHFEVSFVRSSGPGGQHVNKVSSKVDLRLEFESLDCLFPDAKARLRNMAKNRLDADGRIVIVSQKTRDQRQNLEDAREKMRELVVLAMVRPVIRRATKPTKGSKRRRIAGKRVDGAKKADRTKRWGHDE